MLERRLAVLASPLLAVVVLLTRFLRLAVYPVAGKPTAEQLVVRRTGLDRLPEPEARWWWSAVGWLSRSRHLVSSQ